MVTTFAPGPRLRATRIAAATLAPEDVPPKIPSSRASRRVISLASCVATGLMSLTWSGRHSGGMKPMPMPSILCEPEGPPDSTADSAGSTATTRIFGSRRHRACVTPWIECAVLTECTKGATSPRVWRQISSPSGRYPCVASWLLS